MVQDVVDKTLLARANGSNENGSPTNGKPRAPVQVQDGEDDKTNENIFMFIPNLIGEHHTFPLVVRHTSPTVVRR